MRKRLLDLVAPVRPARGDRGYRRILRWAALPVTDRRWAAPLCAAALGFGLFAGVAIGPGASGSFATGASPVIELPGLLADSGGDDRESGAGESGAGEALAGGGSEESAEPFAEEAALPEEAFAEEEAPAEEAPAAAPPDKEAPDDAPAPEEPAQTIAGLVVHANPAAGSYTLAEAGGLLSAVHAAKLPAPGTKVSVPVRTLANGTFAEDGKRKQSGKRTSASIAGIVTFVDPDPAAPAYTVSKRGVSMLIRVRPDPAGATPVLPQIGAYATVSVEIEKAQPGAPPPPPQAPAPDPAPACAPDPTQPLTVPAPTAILWQQTLDADGAPFASSDFAGVIAAICPEEAKLAFSGDDLRQSGEDIVFEVPSSIDLAGLEVGDSAAATAAIEADGTLRLTGLASDERTKGADDAKAAQGDLASQTPR